MIKQMRRQGAYIIDIATQVGCSERTVRRYLKYPEPPARKTRHKTAKLKPFMDYIDTRLAENVWNGEVIHGQALQGIMPANVVRLQGRKRQTPGGFPVNGCTQPAGQYQLHQGRHIQCHLLPRYRRCFIVRCTIFEQIILITLCELKGGGIRRDPCAGPKKKGASGKSGEPG